MPNPDAFALKNSGFDPFLFAGVGTELNGSELTVLSVLARLGMDAWAEAERLATLPKTAATDSLAQRIEQMPMTPQSISAARQTASKLVVLLPSRIMPGVTTADKKMPQWGFAVIWVALALGLLVSSMQHAPAPAPDQPALSLTPPGGGAGGPDANMRR